MFLTYVTATGRALIDRELYLPVSRTDDRDRCREAGISDDVSFATKPQQGVQIGWFTADEAYGDNPGLPDASPLAQPIWSRTPLSVLLTPC